jgi:DNA-binding response OmpR family regulator
MGNNRTTTPQKPRVLVIDDDSGVLERTRDYLEAKGMSVRTTANVFEIPSIVGSFEPQLVVLDLKMPALSGDGVATTLKRMCDVPIVFYSAVPVDDGRAAMAQHAGSSFVSKANGVRELYTGIEAMLRQRSIGGIKDRT